MKRDRLRQYQRRLAPGTPLRAGLDRILHGRTGALVVLGNNPKVQQVSTGGFRLDVEFTPQALRELAKLDGAIILSNDLSRIIAAGVHLVPAGDLPTAETGTRHRSADPSLFTLEPLHNFSAEELLSSQLVAERIGFGESPYLETPIHTRGARLLISVGRLSEGMTTKLINRFSLQELFSVSVSELQQLEGIGSARARLIRDALLRITEAAYARPQTPV